MKCKCENTDVVACVKIKIKGELMNRRGIAGSIDKLVDIEPGDIIQIIRKNGR